ncbi:hypothetical protein TRFO_03670 [Tritrichomonas foetus]|uniref:PQ loop repeat family protein n=1 Tax=Tritrichomonas foetus TaxID=1144522 RepID=A0A1J4KSJ1_9EUKA|nr:hypothetical protein TRFO_03670 [Tritrichomonas foetus]|eukprot:OHT12630.1 hypothetical protein TRFO_03670 [Tritrichomonas foetus]
MRILQTIVMLIFDLCIIISPTVGYIDTIRIMIQTRKPDYYNPNTILLILFAQGNKVLFYIHHPYATLIFGQAISLLLAATILTILKYVFSKNGKPADNSDQDNIINNSENNLSIQNMKDEEKFHDNIDHQNEEEDSIEITLEESNNDIQNISQNIPPNEAFRQTSNIFKYFFHIKQTKTFFHFFISIFLYGVIDFTVFKILCFLMGEKVAVDVLGLIANLVESTTSFPTFVRVVINHDILTVSQLLVFQYFFGDILKIFVFIINETPWSFVFGGCCQLMVDTVMVIVYTKMKCELSHQEENNASPFVDNTQSNLNEANLNDSTANDEYIENLSEYDEKAKEIELEEEGEQVQN